MRANLNIPGASQKQVVVELSWFGSKPTQLRETSTHDHYVSLDYLSFDLGIVQLDIAILGEKETQRQKFWRS